MDVFAACAGTTANNVDVRAIVGCFVHCRFHVNETKVKETGEVN